MVQCLSVNGHLISPTNHQSTDQPVNQPHSLLKHFTGFKKEAFTAWNATVPMANAVVIMAATTNIHQLISVR